MAMNLKEPQIPEAEPIVDGHLICPDCSQVMRVKTYGEEFKNLEKNMADLPYEYMTLVGYVSPKGHSHDDNCWTRNYFCTNGHEVKVGKRRTCPTCDWKGHEFCSCHDYLKLDEFPK